MWLTVSCVVSRTELSKLRKTLAPVANDLLSFTFILILILMAMSVRFSKLVEFPALIKHTPRIRMCLGPCFMAAVLFERRILRSISLCVCVCVFVFTTVGPR